MSEAELENGIHYTLFVEHEVPMEYFTKMDTVISDIVRLAVAHTNQEVDRVLRETKYNIANHLKREVGDIVMGSLPEASEPSSPSAYRW